TERIRNVVVLGHGGCGKTNLLDALAFVSGVTRRHGNVDDGTALTQYRPEEKSHQMSMYCTPARAEWMDTKINLLDTPGYLDFAGEVASAVRVADGAIAVVGARTGVEVGTKMAWERLDARGLPRILFVAKMDREGADFEAAYRDIKEHLTETVIPVEIPIGEGEDFHGIINLFSGKAQIFHEGTREGQYEETDIPPELRDKFESWRTELLENIATTDDTILEHYLESDTISREEAIEGMAHAMRDGKLVPLFCGSAQRTYGMQALLTKIVELLPGPAEATPELATDPETREPVELEASDDGPLAALVFKTTSEPHVGELSFFRIFSGSVDNGDEILNAHTGQSEKLNHLSVPLGAERAEVGGLHAGDIGVVAKLKDTHTNDTLASSDKPLRLEPIHFPTPDTRVAIEAADRSDEDKLGPALTRLHEEDPTFTSGFDPTLKQTIARGLGDLHLDVQFEKLRERYGVSVERQAPRIAYRESIRKEATARGKHKKQSGGRGQYGDAVVRFRPRPRGEGYEFHDKIVGGVIPNKYIPAVDKGIQEAAERGLLAGYPVVDFEAECIDGSHHSVDSSEMAFKVAGSLAFQNAAKDAEPYLLEPVMEVEITVPSQALGDVTGDVSHRRGRIQSMDTRGDNTIISAVIPESELFGYASRLRSLTHGRGVHARRFFGYEEVPAYMAEKVIEESSN
ncbi:MAG: elongation factor G, partial [Myxococcota bacterium]